jgi:hypothetical protein
MQTWNYIWLFAVYACLDFFFLNPISADEYATELFVSATHNLHSKIFV